MFLSFCRRVIGGADGHFLLHLIEVLIIKSYLHRSNILYSYNLSICHKVQQSVCYGLVRSNASSLDRYSQGCSQVKYTLSML